MRQRVMGMPGAIRSVAVKRERRGAGVTARGQRGASAGKRRSGPKGLGHLPFLLLSKSKPRKRLCQQGTNELHTEQQKLPGGAGQEKPDFACTAE